MRGIGALFIATTTTLALAACAGAIGDAESSAVVQWSLLAREDLALTDPARPGSAYPNVGEYQRVEVSLLDDGRLCGVFVEEGFATRRACGGPAVGLPYFVSVDVDARDKLRFRVRDIFGNEVRATTPVGDTCVQRGSDGCSICTDAAGNVVQSDCVPDTASVDGDGVAPSQRASCFSMGADRFIGFVDGELIELGLPTWRVRSDELYDRAQSASEPAPEAEDDGDDQGGIRIRIGGRDPIEAIDGLCEVYADERLEQDDPDDEYIKGSGRLRCGHLANDGLVRACRAVPQGCAEESLRSEFERGLLAAHNAWTGGDDGAWAYESQFLAGDEGADEPSEPSPELPPSPENPEGEAPECSGSPLVLSLDDGPITLMSLEDGVEFDLWGHGRPVSTGWVSRGALLALDLDFNGRIDSGRELFGEATVLASGGFADNGFEALAQYDGPRFGGNGDGVIDRDDGIHPLLLAWTDLDRDGASSPGELKPLAETGVRAIHLDFEAVAGEASGVHAAGNEVGLAARLERADGSSAVIYDVWFRYASPRTGGLALAPAE